MALAPLNRRAALIHQAAKDNGWYDGKPRTFGEIIALMHSELSEALEEYRAGHTPAETYYNPDKPTKPEGIPSEFADVLIRVLDSCAYYGIDLDKIVGEKLAYNATRGHKHGGKVI